MPQTIVETRPYQRAVDLIWDEQTQIDFKNYIGLYPMQGDIIPGTGGVRKIRWQGTGHGKRGGVRVIYYLYDDNHPIYLLYAYPKNAKLNLSEAEKKAFKEATEEIKRTFREKEERSHG
ncbi:MAG: type II toxin-antitoxin system RelE/ParE family toxin [Schwartzia sp.]|nr:type II toxin-antitoxin system RelE/ParE family toxin [Schwartzia sp. (in: firmicutes)]